MASGANASSREVAELLQAARGWSEAAGELRALGERLVARLAALASGEDGGAALLLAGEALDFLRIEAERPMALRLADASRVSRLWRLNQRVDAAFQALGRADTTGDWAREWSQQVDELEQHMMEIATQSADMMVAELELPEDRSEALAVVKHAFERMQKEKRGKAGSRAELQDHEELLRVLFRRLVTTAGVEVPVLPRWFVSPGDIRIDGAGSHPAASTGSVVYAFWSRPDGNEQRVIVKRLEPTEKRIESKHRAALVANEVSLLSSLKHANLLKTVGGCHVSRTPFVLLECPAPLGEGVVTLDEYLTISVDHQRLALRLLAQAARGLQALHETLGAAHGDVRCANIFVGDDHRAKLGNLTSFSLTRVREGGVDEDTEAVLSGGEENQDEDNTSYTAKLRDWQRKLSTRAPLRWQSPEMIAGKDEDPGFASDIYALGICLIEALSGELPWGFMSDREVRKRIRAGELPPEAKSMDENVKSLVEAMCDVNAAARPDIATVMEELEALAEEEQARDGVQNYDSKSRDTVGSVRLDATITMSGIGKRGSVSDGMAATMSAIPRRRQSDAQLRTTIGGVAGLAVATDARIRRLSSPPLAAPSTSGSTTSAAKMRRPSSASSNTSTNYGRGGGYPGSTAASDYGEADGVVAEELADDEDQDGTQYGEPATVTTVTLRSKWLGVKINSVGNRILLSKFLRAESGAAGELEASRRVALGDEILAVNGRRVRGSLDRVQLGALVQSLPRPMSITFRRDPRALTNSFRFHGLRVDSRWRDRGSAVTLPGPLDSLLTATSRGFALDMWFSLADVREDFYLGGVLLGAQDVDVDATNSSAGSTGEIWPYVHRALLAVDPSGTLWCDMLATPDGPMVVATDLVPGQWYHLSLSYTLDQQQQQLAVFLDGEKRAVAYGPLLPEWPRLRYVTLGTGCMSGVSPAKPSPNFTGWFGFSGLVHDMRIWHAALSDVQSRQLYRSSGVGACVDSPAYSLKRSGGGGDGVEISAEVVPSTRPHHVVAQVYC